jgi:hypothetical protein
VKSSGVGAIDRVVRCPVLANHRVPVTTNHLRGGKPESVAAGVVLLAAFAAWQGRAPHPLLPPRVVLDRNRGGAYASMLVAGAGLFGTFFFLTYYF